MTERLRSLFKLICLNDDSVVDLESREGQNMAARLALTWAEQAHRNADHARLVSILDFVGELSTACPENRQLEIYWYGALGYARTLRDPDDLRCFVKGLKSFVAVHPAFSPERVDEFFHEILTKYSLASGSQEFDELESEVRERRVLRYKT